MGRSASEGDIVQVGSNESQQNHKASCQVRAWKNRFHICNDDPSGLSAGKLDASGNEELASALLRDFPSYSFIKKPKGQQIQNLTPLKKKDDLFLVNNG